MHSDISPDAEGSASDAARRAGLAIVITATIVLAGDALLTCPSRFSKAHQNDTSLLRPLVSVLGLFGEFGTARGVEIRNLVFYIGAASVSIIAGICLATGSVRSRYSIDDLLDGRSRAASPVFWWFVLLIVSALSSIFSHAPSFCQGQMIVRLLHFAWWWPIATILSPRQVRALAIAFVAVLSATAAVGLAYQFIRIAPNQPGARLQYPLGNELWLAACLLPGLFIACSIAVSALRTGQTHEYDSEAEVVAERKSKSARWPGLIASLLAAMILMMALVLTRSRSAAVGLAAGVFAIVVMILPARRRLPAIFVICLIGVAAALTMQQLRADGSTAARAHSIRARLDYEWPYALRLFMSKPIAGNGDGAYSLLAGGLGRDDQLDDPGIMRFDESSWPAHAHNEFLELLSDVGLVGTIAFMVALGIPLYRALRFCDEHRYDPNRASQRWLAMGLSGALVAMIVEACGTPAIREPGANAIFITVWACLWACVRRQGRPSPSDSDEKPVATNTVRLFGVGVCIAAVVLGYRGAQDWWAMRARYEATQHLSQGEFARAVADADFAAASALDPFQRTSAFMISAWARSLLFDQLIATTDRPLNDEEMDVSRNALMRLSVLDHAAPRFLRVSRLRADLSLNRARAYARRGDLRNEAECRRDFAAALERSRADEPFLIDRVENLWRINQTATTADRLLWLKCLLRGGEVEPTFESMLRAGMAAPDFNRTLSELVETAREDADRQPAQWRDRLSPESLRLAAMALAIQGDFAKALELLAVAENLYEKAMPRLFAGLGATIHDAVRYRVLQAPLESAAGELAEIGRAYRAAHGNLAPGELIPDPSLGRTRALLLLLSGDEPAAQHQLERIQRPGDPPTDQRLADLYLQLATIMTDRSPDHLRIARDAAGRAAELVPDSPRPHAIAAELSLASGDKDAALTHLRRLTSLPSDPRVDPGKFLSALRDRFRDSTVWAELEPELAELIPTTSTAPAD